MNILHLTVFPTTNTQIDKWSTSESSLPGTRGRRGCWIDRCSRILQSDSRKRQQQARTRRKRILPPPKHQFLFHSLPPRQWLQRETDGWIGRIAPSHHAQAQISISLPSKTACKKKFNVCTLESECFSGKYTRDGEEWISNVLATVDCSSIGITAKTSLGLWLEIWFQTVETWVNASIDFLFILRQKLKCTCMFDIVNSLLYTKIAKTYHNHEYHLRYVFQIAHYSK